MLPTPDAARWVSLAQAAHERVCAEVMLAAVSQLHGLAHTVHSATPPWEHLFATSTLDLKLASKSLLKWPRKKQLGAGVTALDSGIRAAAQTYTEWGLAGTLRDSAPLAEQMRLVDSIYLAAKKACYITAGVNCLVNLKGEERLKKREQLIPAQAALLPPKLVQLLGKLK